MRPSKLDFLLRSERKPALIWETSCPASASFTKLSNAKDNAGSPFNYINGHFLDKDSENLARRFLQSEDGGTMAASYLVLVDPPFHPELLPAIKQSVERFMAITGRSGSETPIMLCFPYFFKDKVTSVFSPAMKILESVGSLTYSTHPKMKTEAKSPVRLFTSLPPEKFSE
jgi:hypothetical protein